MNSSEKISRPNLLTWLCIGSASFGVLWIIMFLVMITYSVIGDVPSGLFPGLTLEYLHAGYLFMVAEILLTTIGVAGVMLMWQIKKTGFYLYATTKTVIYFLPVVFLGSNHLTFPGLIITSIFIIMYGTLFTRVNKK